MSADSEIDEIETITAIEAIRGRSHMYFPWEGRRNQILLEALCLSLAEAHCGTCSVIEIQAFDRQVSISDNGIGLSLKRDQDDEVQIERIFTDLFGCRDHKAHAELGHELCVSGIVAVNALSEVFVVDVHAEGEIQRLEFTDGKKVNSFHAVGSTNRSGTDYRFTIAEEFAGEEPFDLDALRDSIHSKEIDLSRTEIAITPGQNTY